jgi:hypothetical protein
MVQAVPSKLALATVADFARDPAGYDPVASFERALAGYGAEVVDALRALAPGPAQDVAAPGDAEALADALFLGVDAATALALLEPFVSATTRAAAEGGTWARGRRAARRPSPGGRATRR